MAADERHRTRIPTGRCSSQVGDGPSQSSVGSVQKPYCSSPSKDTDPDHTEMAVRRLTVATLALIAACGASEMATIDGIVTAIDGDLTTVESFDVLTTDGETISLVPAPFGRFDFPLPHLSSHMRTLEPVRITYETTDDGIHLAREIGDAPTEDSP